MYGEWVSVDWCDAVFWIESDSYVWDEPSHGRENELKLMRCDRLGNWIIPMELPHWLLILVVWSVIRSVLFSRPKSQWLVITSIYRWIKPNAFRNNKWDKINEYCLYFGQAVFAAVGDDVESSTKNIFRTHSPLALPFWNWSKAMECRAIKYNPTLQRTARRRRFSSTKWFGFGVFHEYF